MAVPNPVPPFSIVSRDQHGRAVYVRQRHGERFKPCCLQESPCEWHAQHGDEIKEEARPTPVAAPRFLHRKPVPPRVRRYLDEDRKHGEGRAMFQSDDELYAYALEKRKQWESQPVVSWVGFLAYMLTCDYEDARAIARWVEPKGGWQATS